ncbi:MAG: SPL family radical SAM protein [Fidelibacterota bacterium]
MNHNNHYRRIYISKSALRDEATEAILSKYPRRIQRVIPDDYDIAGETAGMEPKTVLWLNRSKGDVVKSCPGTAEQYLCCNYQVINQTLNCPMGCSYCILQYYLNQPATIVYTNFDEIFTEVQTELQRQPRRFFRIGTGELGDSLALAGSAHFARRAIEWFADIPNALLELKTKTTEIEDLLNLRHGGHTVLAWSLNPQPIIDREEHKTAHLMPRLAAAKRAAEAGYLLAFHFDPILHVRDWKELYGDLLDELYLQIDPSRIAWISMGSLRFPPSMKAKIIARYPRSTVSYAEMVRGMDGKLRYPRPLRVPMYRFIYQRLTSISSPPFLYFCMESPLVWREVFGSAPESNAHLDFMFAESLYRRFPGLLTKEPQRIDYERGWGLEMTDNGEL